MPVTNPPTVQFLRENNGVIRLLFACMTCQAKWTMPTDRYHSNDTVPGIQRDVFCAECRSDDVDVRPDFPKDRWAGGAKSD
mgnify:CR=1 FL=1